MTTNDKDQVVTTIRLPCAVYARMQQLATNQHRTFSQQMRLAVDEHLARFESVEREAA